MKFEKVFLRMDFEDEAYNTYFHKQQTSGGLGALDVSDFYDCRLFVNFLKLFYNASKKFSGSLYDSSNSLFDEIYIIQTKINELKNSKETFCNKWPQTCI